MSDEQQVTPSVPAPTDAPVETPAPEAPAPEEAPAETPTEPSADAPQA
ncbi:hypothetical protein KJ781_02930 [Patescibacteria group bacterium]|nr:hypothetical protein [Patescibacteria group bacterium]MBU2613598.1 hypothetical protein [Patescibacteria group bacterium]